MGHWQLETSDQTVEQQQLPAADYEHPQRSKWNNERVRFFGRSDIDKNTNNRRLD